MVNDSDKTIDPKIAESRIVINGEVLADSARILTNGPRDTRYGALSPGDLLRFVFALGDHFERPGVYRVSWWVEGFKSPEVVFRVLPSPRTISGPFPQAPPGAVMRRGDGGAIALHMAKYF